MFIIFLFSLIKAEVIIGTQPPNIDEQLQINLDEKSIRIQYCLANENYRKGISNNEFNYPDAQKFLKLNQQLIQQYITEAIFQDINTKAALYHYDNWRCKQYTIYDYHEEEYAIQKINIENRLLSILKSDSSELKSNCMNILECKTWQYQLYINSSTQQKQHKFNHACTNDQVTYQYERQLFGAGLHQYIQTKITFNSEINEDIVIIDELDTYTYIDKDEMDKLSYQTQLMTIVDIERPSELSTQHIFISKHKGQKEIIYSMPYHFRYHLAANEHYKTSYVPNTPRVFLNHNTSIFDKSEIYPSKLSQHLTYQVPVGYLPYKNYVFIITIGITLGLALHIAKLIMKSQN